MQRHYDTLLEEQRGPFTVIVDKTWEDCPLADLFDTAIDPDTGLPYYDIAEMARQIDRGDLDYFMLRVRVFVQDIELAADYVGGFLYEDARETLTDGAAEDMIYTALTAAEARVTALADTFSQMALARAQEVDSLG
jgi:hypothetical protein